MIKNVIKLIAITVIAVLTLTGCAENREKPLDVNEIVNSVFEESSTSSEIEENSTSEVEATSTSTVENSTSTVEKPTASTSEVESKPEEKPISSSTSTVEKPVEKPISSSTTTTSSTTSKPVEKPTSSSTTTTSSKPASSSTPASSSSTTTSKPVEKPVASTSSTTSSTTSKPVEKPAYNCDIDGHIWEVTTTTTEPKWCREMHYVFDNGYDVTLASRYLGVDEDEAYYTFINNMEAIGVDGEAGSATITVEVWGTETYEDKKCKVCNHSEVSVNVYTITPIGEWQYVNGKNPRIKNPNLNFNTLFYDPYNVPQVVIDNINLKWELMWG